MLESMVAQRTSELEDSRLDIILRLGKAAEYRDEETGNHILRVGCYSRAVGGNAGDGRGVRAQYFAGQPAA